MSHSRIAFQQSSLIVDLEVAIVPKRSNTCKLKPEFLLWRLALGEKPALPFPGASRESLHVMV